MQNRLYFRIIIALVLLLFLSLSTSASSGQNPAQTLTETSERVSNPSYGIQEDYDSGLPSTLFDDSVLTPDNSWNVDFIGQIGGGSPQAVAVQGNYAFIGLGSRLAVLDISDPTSLHVVGKTQPFPCFPLAIAISSGYAFIADGLAGMRVVNISDPFNPVEIGFYNTPGSADDLAVSGSYAYVVIDEVGLHVVDISNPLNPVEVGTFISPGYPNAVAISGDYAYLADGVGLRIIDVSTPTHPVEVGFYESSGTYGFARDVALSGDYAFVAEDYNGLRVVDISNPTDPVEVGFYVTPYSAWSVVISGSYAYVIDGIGLRVVNISDPYNPVMVGSYAPPEGPEHIAISGDNAYTINYSSMRVLDISNPSSPTEISFYDTSFYASNVAILGGNAFITDQWNGIWVVDITNPTSPVEVGFYDAPGYPDDIDVLGRYAYVATGATGLRVVDITDPTAPVEVGSYIPPVYEYVTDVTVSNGYAFLTGTPFVGMRIVDISNPYYPIEVSSHPYGPDWIYDVAISGDYAYLAAGPDGLRVVSIFNPANPSEVGFVDMPNYAYDVAVYGDYAFVADNTSLQIVNISDPHNPFVVGFYNVCDSLTSVAVSGNNAYIADVQFNLQVLDISNPSTPVQVGFYETPQRPSGITFSDGYTFLADGSGGLFILHYTGDGTALVDLDASAATIRLASGNNHTKRDQPYASILETDIINHGPNTASQVNVQFYDGLPGSGTLIASTTVDSIDSGATNTARANWFVPSSPTAADIYVQVSAAETDTNPSNNVSSQGTPAYVAFADYAYNPDTFVFGNWTLTWSDFLAELEAYYLHLSPDIWRYIVGPYLYALSASGGHCYGMAQASIIYWDTPSAKPVAKDTYAMSQSEVALDLHDQNVRQLLYAVPIRMAGEYVPGLLSPNNAYREVRQRLSGNPSTPAVLSLELPIGGHAMVAFKVVEIGGQKYIYLYDNNDPMSVFPGSEPQAQLRLDESANRLIAGDYPISDALATDPVRDPSEITAEMIEDIYEYVLLWLERGGWLQGFFSWGEGGTETAAAPSQFLITDNQERRLGYDQGTLVNEIPGAYFNDFGTGFHWLLPHDGEYRLETDGVGSSGASLSFAIPSSGFSVQEVVYSGFDLPLGAAATTDFGRETQDWRIQVEGEADVLPTIIQQTEVSIPYYLPFMMK